MIPWSTALPFFYFLDFRQKEVYHAARFEKGSRYYVLRLEKDLLGDWTIRVVNGRIRSKLGQSRTLAFPCFTEGFTSFCAIAKHRYQRGYHLQTLACENHFLLQLLPFFSSFKDCSNPVKTKGLRKKKTDNQLLPKIPQQINYYQNCFTFK